MNNSPSKPSVLARIVPAAIHRLRRLGIRIAPFLVVREGATHSGTGADSGELSFVFLGPQDVAALLQLEPGTDANKLQTWFAQGKLCFAVKAGARLVAKMWCDLDAFNYPPAYRKLEPDEAYLFAAYADPGYRGRNVAPLMRAACYEALRKMGRTRFCSYTDYYNSAARRFKAKLGALDEALYVHVDLAGRWSRTIPLKRYR